MKLIFTLIIGTTLFAASASAWEPDPGCTAVQHPIPKVRSCAALIDNYIDAHEKYHDAAERLTQWGEFLRDLNRKLVDDMIDRSLDALNPIPTDASSLAGCFLDVCKKGLGTALMFGTLAYGHSQDVATGKQAGDAYRSFAAEVEGLRVALEEAGKDLEECEQLKAVEEADAQRVRDRNKNAKARYPADHERCNPPKDTGPIGEDQKTGGDGDKVGQGGQQDKGGH